MEYSEFDLDFLRNNYKSMTNNELAVELSRSEDGIAYKLKELGLRRRNNHAVYTDEEKKFIEEHHGIMTINEIAEELGRSASGIAKFVSKYRVGKIRKRAKVHEKLIEKDVVPFFSKSDTFFEVIQNLSAGDSFEYPDCDKSIVNQQKYILLNQLKKQGKKERVFMTRKITKEKRRMWRLI